MIGVIIRRPIGCVDWRVCALGNAVSWQSALNNIVITFYTFAVGIAIHHAVAQRVLLLPMEHSVVRLPVGALMADLCAVPYEPGEPINKSPGHSLMPATTNHGFD